MPKIRILVVDDGVVMRRLLTEVLQRAPDIEVVGTAPNGRIALQKLAQVTPDLVTLDLEMPVLDGIETLRALRLTHPDLPVIMLSAVTRQGAAATLDALAAGANDYITKPSEVRDLEGSIAILESELLPRVRQLTEVVRLRQAPTAAVHSVRPIPPEATPPVRRAVPLPGATADARTFELLCISTSTGGPNALADLFARFTQPPPVPVVIVQHMPPMFTALLAERLNKLPGSLGCVEARDGQRLQPGHAYLAPGGRHLVVNRLADRQFVARLADTPPENSCRPAADVMLRSAAATGARILSVVMTGMGCDGLRGCEFVIEAGGAVMIQDRESSVIWGMPGAIAQAGLPHTTAALADLATHIELRLNRRPQLVA